MTQNSKCCVKKVKATSNKKTAIVTFDCHTTAKFFAPGPPIGIDKLCPVHYTKIRKLKPKGINPCVEVYNELAGNSL
jgi:hypothetical protein